MLAGCWLHCHNLCILSTASGELVVVKDCTVVCLLTECALFAAIELFSMALFLSLSFYFFSRGRLFKSPLKTEKVPSSASSVATASTGQASALIPETKRSKLHDYSQAVGFFLSSSLTFSLVILLYVEKSIDPFNEFMKTLKRPAAQDLVQHLKMLA